MPVPSIDENLLLWGRNLGLAATVYAASEGLRKMLLDSVAVGGQAAASSRIENYLGFRAVTTGVELTSRPLIQANKFGAQVYSPCDVVELDCHDGHLHVGLANGTVLDTRAVRDRHRCPVSEASARALVGL